MDKKTLADELKLRQYKQGLVPRALIDSLTDDQIIDSYNTCSCCDTKFTTEKELEEAIKMAENAEHFFELCDMFGEIRHNQKTSAQNNQWN